MIHRATDRPQLAGLSGPLVSQLPTRAAVEHAAIRSYVENEKAAGTRRAYRSDFRIFSTWCSDRDLSAVPATADTVAAFLAAEADAGVKTSTIGRRLAAISYAHELADAPSPTETSLVRVTMRGIRRTIGGARIKKAPATAECIGRMVAQIPEGLAGKRDRALLLLGFACALRRSELVALDVADLEHVPDGLLVTIRRSKTDQEAVGATIPVPSGGRLQVAEMLSAWLHAAGITSGAIFRAIDRNGHLRASRLSAGTVAAIVKAYAGRAGMDAATFAGHSLRRGFLTTAAHHKAALFKMQRISRHKSADNLLGYIEDADQFQDHAGTGFL